MRHSIESEQIVLGAIMWDSTVLDEITVRAEEFYEPKHSQLFTLLQSEVSKGNPVELKVMGTVLGANKIPGVDLAYMHKIYQSVVLTTDALHHGKIVSSLARMRKVEQLGHRMQSLAENGEWDSADSVLAEARSVLDAAESNYAPTRVRSFHDALGDAMDDWANPETSTAIPTGWADLDRVFNGGWKPGKLTVLGARPAVGKSLIAACAALQVGDDNGVGFISLEMKELEIVARMTANKATVNLSKIERRDLTDEDWAKIRRLYNSQVGKNLFLSFDANTSAESVRSQVKRWAKVKKPSLLVVDYLQLMEPSNKSDSREKQIGELSRQLKMLAMEMDIHVLSLAQVNRDAVGRRPRMSDLRESGAIEANADNILLLDRDDENNPGEIEVLVEKNRQGETAEISLAWQPHYSRASDLWQG